MSNRLRNQELTGRPRVIAEAGEYKVQWLGRYSGDNCEYRFGTLGDALGLANQLAVARRYKK